MIPSKCLVQMLSVMCYSLFKYTFLVSSISLSLLDLSDIQSSFILGSRNNLFSYFMICSIIQELMMPTK